MYHKNQEENHILEFCQGSEKALRYIFNLYYAPLCYYAQSLVYNIHVAEDIASEAFMKLWQLRYRFNSEPAIKSFLSVSIRNACYNFLKKERRKTVHEKDFCYLLSTFEEENRDEVALVDVLQQVYNYIERLPMQQKQTCKLLFLEGFNVSDVAVTLGLSEQTVRNHKARALHYLRVVVIKTINDLPEKKRITVHNQPSATIQTVHTRKKRVVVKKLSLL